MFRTLIVIGTVALTGCATSPPPHAAAGSDIGDAPPAGSWTKSNGSHVEAPRVYDDSGVPLVGVSTDLALGTDDRFASHTIGTSDPPPPPRPRRVGKRDISLSRARLDNALRWLAREGRFNLVIEGDIGTLVTLELQRVEPYDAVLALAEANHLRLDYRSGIVIVRRGGASTQTAALAP